MVFQVSFNVIQEHSKPFESVALCQCEDLPQAMTAAEVTEKLGLHNLRHRRLTRT